jgi:hypothetical protein
MEEKIILELIKKLTKAVGELNEVAQTLNSRIYKLELDKISKEDIE